MLTSCGAVTRAVVHHNLEDVHPAQQFRLIHLLRPRQVLLLRVGRTGVARVAEHALAEHGKHVNMALHPDLLHRSDLEALEQDRVVHKDTLASHPIESFLNLGISV